MNTARSFILAGLIIFLPSLAFATANLPSQTDRGSLIGKTAYDISLPTALGGQRSLSQACGGKKSVLFFWATWCPHCHDEIMRMNADLSAITAKGINIVLISVGETKEQVAAYLKSNDVPLDSLLDEDNALQEPYGLVGVPTLFFVDEKGVIRGMRHDFPDHYEELFSVQ